MFYKHWIFFPIPFLGLKDPKEAPKEAKKCQFLFFIKFWCRFFVEWIVLRTFGSVSPNFLYLLQFPGSTWSKEGEKCQFPKFESFFYFSSNFNAVFCEVFILTGYWWAIKIAILFLLGTQILKFRIFVI